MKKLSQHDEREIKSYVKFNPHSLSSHKGSKSKALDKAKGETKAQYLKSSSINKGYKGSFYKK